MTVLDRIDSVSAGKMASFFGVFVGIAIGLVVAFIALLATHSGAIALLGFLLGIAGSVILLGIYGAIVSWFYNIAASSVGGIKLNFLNFGKSKSAQSTLKSVDVASYAKVSAIMLTLIAVLAVLILLFIFATGIHALHHSLPFILGVCVAIIIAGAVLGLVAGALMAVFYNFAAKNVGGIKMIFKNNKGACNKVLGYIDYMSYAKVYVVIAAIWGIIELVIRIAAPIAFTSYFGLHSGLGVGVALASFVVLVIWSFVLAIIISLVYNSGAGRVGAVQLKLR